MKNILLFAFIVFCLNVVQAQVEVSIAPDPSIGSAVLDDLSTNPKDIVGHALVTNNSTVKKTYSWTRNVISKPDVWATGVCDVNLCYAPHVSSQEFDLEAGQAATMDVHAYPSGSPGMLDGAVTGEATIEIVVTEVDNEENTTTAQFILTLTETVSSISNQEIEQLQLFPNPAVSAFELKGPEGVEYLKVYNLLGTEIMTYQHFSGNQYDISALPKGLYLISLLDEDTQLLKTVRLQKQ